MIGSTGGLERWPVQVLFFLYWGTTNTLLFKIFLFNLQRALMSNPQIPAGHLMKQRDGVLKERTAIPG